MRGVKGRELTAEQGSLGCLESPDGDEMTAKQSPRWQTAHTHATQNTVWAPRRHMAHISSQSEFYGAGAEPN